MIDWSEKNKKNKKEKKSMHLLPTRISETGTTCKVHFFRVNLEIKFLSLVLRATNYAKLKKTKIS